MSQSTFTERLVVPQRVIWPKSFGSVSPDFGFDRFILHHDTNSEDDPAGTVGSTILIDFGQELFGGIRFEVIHVGPREQVKVKIRFGESVSEAIVGCFDVKTLNVRAGESLNIGKTGFRFVRIDLVDDQTTAELAKVRAFCVYRELEYRGSFRCSDDRLERIWAIGANTVHLCLQELIWDGIKRGCRVWAGDLYPAASVVTAVFGDLSIVPESLDHVRDQTIVSNSETVDWMNGIAAYSLWWIITQEEWYLSHGQLSYLDEQREYLRRLLAMVFNSVDGEGREQLRGWRFLDWASSDRDTAIHGGFQGLTAWALGAASRLCDILGEVDLRDRCLNVIEELKRYRLPNTPSKQAWALLTLGGIADATEVNRVVLSQDPMQNLSPFLAYPVLEARAKAGDYVGSLNLIRTYWGAMMDLGATTFWEDFDIAWVPGSAKIDEIVADDARDVPAEFGRCGNSGLAQSLCHGWSAGPTAWLSRHVLGIHPIEPGCVTVRILPQLGDLDWAEGNFPTPQGQIHVRHERKPNGTIASEITSPSSVRVVNS